MNARLSKVFWAAVNILIGMVVAALIVAAVTTIIWVCANYSLPVILTIVGLITLVAAHELGSILTACWRDNRKNAKAPRTSP